jgi:F-type H+-transporting ATPase subunit delta
MTTSAVARQYANAAYDVARRNGHVEEFGRQLQTFADLVATHADLRNALESVAVPRQAKRDVIGALAAHIGPVSDECQRLLGLMADNDRLALIPVVADEFRQRAMEAAGVVRAELVSAQPLDADRQAALARALGAVTGQRVEVTGRVDESIIGGVIAKVGGTVYDGSVASQLERMRQRLVTDA